MTLPDAFRVGGVAVSPPLVLAPMSGLTDVTFRRVARSCGGVGLAVSEIVSAAGIINGGLPPEDYLAIAADEHPVALQLSGSDPALRAEAARRCEAEGADIVDINMGCPSPKITKNMCGSALLRDPDLAATVTKAVVDAVAIPVTAKMRTGWTDDSLTFLEIARRLEDVGAAAVALHGRTRKQGYSGESDWGRIAELKAAVSIPVVGNGDVQGPEDVLEMFRQTGCDGVMVGRAAVANPWIFSQAVELAARGRYERPGRAERLALVRRQFEELEARPNAVLALHYMRSFLGKYTREMPEAAPLRRQLNGIASVRQGIAAFDAWCEQILGSESPVQV
ncbi:MAG: tRNA dihydrouridine synthase DusB [Acidobacteriota bacterium]